MTLNYLVDERESGLGHQVIETKMEILYEREWNVATEIWHEEQSDAVLIQKGKNTTGPQVTQQMANALSLPLSL